MSTAPARIYSDASTASLTLNWEVVVIIVALTALVCAISMVLAAKFSLKRDEHRSEIRGGFYK